MIRDEEIREKRASGGVLGGNPALKNIAPKVAGKVNLHANLQPTPSSSSAISSSSSSIQNTGRATLAPPDGVSDSVWQDFLKIRKAKKAPMTETALAGIRREADIAGVDLQKAIEICCERGWQGFKADWHQQAAQGKPQQPTRHADSAEETLRMLAQRKAETKPPPPEIRALISDALKGKVSA
jgi:hypothetical protein